MLLIPGRVTEMLDFVEDPANATIGNIKRTLESMRWSREDGHFYDFCISLLGRICRFGNFLSYRMLLVLLLTVQMIV